MSCLQTIRRNWLELEQQGNRPYSKNYLGRLLVEADAVTLVSPTTGV